MFRAPCRRKMTDEMSDIRKLETEIRKELGLLQLRLKMEAQKEVEKVSRQKKPALSLGIREHVTLFIVVFVLLFFVSPVFRDLVVAAYKHYVLGVDLAKLLNN